MDQPAPDADLKDQHGACVRLSRVWADGPAFLVFYPGDDTAVCTAQLCDYRDHWHTITERGVGLVGINPASVERHARFAARHRFPFPLLSDPGGVCCRAYGARAWYGTRRMAVLVVDGMIRGRIATWPWRRPRSEALLRLLDRDG